MSTRHSKTQTLETAGKQYQIYPLEHLSSLGDVESLPYSLKLLLENLLRHGKEQYVTDDDVEALVNWDPKAEPSQEVAFVPARVLLQDFTGVPAIVDLAVMRDAMVELGGEAGQINPLSPVELVIDHSVMVDHFGKEGSLEKNTDIELQRNLERYKFLRWGQDTFSNFRVVPPGTGIVHQVNLEYLARGVFAGEQDGKPTAYPDTLVGTDSHTTMINGLGVLGWGVGGIEAEAAMLGQPVTMLIPQVVGMRLDGRLAEGATATDLVLTVTQLLREHGVVGKFVEFFGPGLKHLTLADRATIANMAPEYGATCGIFPVDAQTIEYLKLTGRDEEQLALVEDYMKTMGLWHDDDTKPARYSATLELQLDTVVPSLAGPRRPQDRIALTDSKENFSRVLREYKELSVVTKTKDDWEDEGGQLNEHLEAVNGIHIERPEGNFSLRHGSVVIAAITSCTNTSNPEVLIAAGLVARKARELGLVSKPWVKTSLAPGSKVVTGYLERTGLMEDLEALGFYLVGYGCTTCIGNSGPLPDDISDAIREGNLMVASVLSGNRNFEGRIHQDVRANYLASPPLVVAYAIAGRMDIDLYNEPMAESADGKPVFLADLWPDNKEINEILVGALDTEMFRERYSDVYTGNESWNKLPVEGGERYPWPESTYVRKPTFFEGIADTKPGVSGIQNARCLVKVGDSITTDHISPAGAIAADSPAGKYLQEQGVEVKDFNSYGSRRGNHEVMMRGTFANVRMKNQLAPGTEGSWTTNLLNGNQESIYDASVAYREQGIPLVVLAGLEYGTGSSRDWAAKGPSLLGVRVVIARSYERIHRSNLIGMGILPLQYKENESAESLGLDGTESFSIEAVKPGQEWAEVVAVKQGGNTTRFDALIRIDTPNEFSYYENGGILHYVLRRMAGRI
ncbi:aconitate hydratase AcnA [Parahaliea sp. F7430]|uniref:Aconitate hydratase n=1 Tax=Sediminihaliea albiluteola TaxID=2758564 RepID=A0A7W2TXE5_9GAMM|nr:aconitate hydratase AcnA [Sediminihaliea albiluteola]MBA6413731.1 aconitate hydratase AcnA [Sediminihaliea albiluteola]